MSGLSSLSSAGQGLQSRMQAFDRAAASVNAATSPTGSDLVDAMVGLRQAASDVKANMAIVRTADEMLGTLLDMQA